MATERLSMRKTRDVLRLKWEQGRTHRETAASLRIGLGSVTETLKRVTAAGLDWKGVSELDDVALEERIYGKRTAASTSRPMPDPIEIHVERKRPGVTLELLHQEYLARHPDGLRYTQFCDVYRTWLRKQRLVMRQEHRAGEKLFVDYSGKKPHLVDPLTGECTDVELFVAVHGASNFTYAEVSRTQQVREWIASHERAYAYSGGVCAMTVSDQLKSGVTRACRYEPEIQRTYEDFARHYNTTVVPARPLSPRDKAKVEVGVQIAQRWLLARIRNERFATTTAMNRRLGELLVDLNNRVMRGYGVSRRHLFETVDRPALRPLPAERYEFAEWKIVTVHIDYHVEFEFHYYSVPFTYAHEKLELRATEKTIEVFRNRERVASHARSHARGKHTTVIEHMPKAHQKHAEWTPARLCNWASKIGPSTEALVCAILEDRPHPEQGYRSCLGILRLGRHYGDQRLEAACTRAVAVRARSYRSVESILKHGLDRVPIESAKTPRDESPRPAHENIRGRDYYK